MQYTLDLNLGSFFALSIYLEHQSIQELLFKLDSSLILSLFSSFVLALSYLLSRGGHDACSLYPGKLRRTQQAAIIPLALSTRQFSIISFLDFLNLRRPNTRSIIIRVEECLKLYSSWELFSSPSYGVKQFMWRPYAASPMM